MAVRTTNEIMESVKTIIGERDDDEVIAFMEDLSDTLNAFSEEEKWKEKYEENDKEWRRKYLDRFNNKEVKEEEVEEVETVPLTYSELFKTE